MAMIKNLNLKFEYILSELNENYTRDEFIDMFIELYSSDWNKIVSRYAEHEAKTKKNKRHPMPKPRQYVLNVSYKVRNT